jgi:hypothetical protein
LRNSAVPSAAYSWDGHTEGVFYDHVDGIYSSKLFTPR